MTTNLRPAVFLDRDGVIMDVAVRDGKAYSVRRLEDLRLLPGVREAVDALRQAGFLIVVATNQPDIANGIVDRAVIEAMHARLRELLPLDGIEMCPHADWEDCQCRKPKPGLLVMAAQRLGIDLSRSIMVGDRWKDVDAGRTAGCRTVFIDRGYREPRPANPDLVVESLLDAVPWITALGAGPRN